MTIPNDELLAIVFVCLILGYAVGHIIGYRKRDREAFDERMRIMEAELAKGTHEQS